MLQENPCFGNFRMFQRLAELQCTKDIIDKTNWLKAQQISKEENKAASFYVEQLVTMHTVAEVSTG